MRHYFCSRIACILLIALGLTGCRDKQYPRPIKRILNIELDTSLNLGPLQGYYNPKRMVKSITSLKSLEEIEDSKDAIENLRTSIIEPVLWDTLVNLVNAMPNLKFLSVHFPDSFRNLERLSIDKLTAFCISGGSNFQKAGFPQSLLLKNNLVSLSIADFDSSSVFWNLSESDIQFRKLKYLELSDKAEESFPRLYPYIKNLELLNIFHTNIKRLDYQQIEQLGLRELKYSQYQINNFNLDSLAKTSVLLVSKGGDEYLYRCDKSEMFIDTLVRYGYAGWNKAWMLKREHGCPDTWFAY